MIFFPTTVLLFAFLLFFYLLARGTELWRFVIYLFRDKRSCGSCFNTKRDVEAWERSNR